MNYLYKAQTDFDMSVGAHEFFQSFFMTITKNGLISDKQIDWINQQIMMILERSLRLHTRSVNSSVPSSVAQHVMQSNLYAISYYLKQFSFDECISLITNTPLFSLLDEGKKQIREDVEKAKYAYSMIKDSRIKTKNHAYNDTLGHGVNMFFSNYNVDEKAHETPGSIDYPVRDTEIGFVGIEYMTRYLEKLYFENTFCKSFDDREIEALLKGYSDSYADLLINIFETVLTNIVGNVLLGNSTRNLVITDASRLHLIKKLCTMPPLRLKLELANISTKIINAYDIQSDLFKSHITSAVMSISHTIGNAVKHNKLDTVFISYKNNKTKALQIDDSNKLTDEEFRYVTDEIRSCRHTKDKINIIKQNIKSLSDLTDVLSTYCIHQDEYSVVFDSMQDIELALLLKYVSENLSDSIHTTQGELEWCNSLHNYINGMEATRKDSIYTIVGKVATSI